MSRFDYVKYDQDAMDLQAEFKERCEDLSAFIDSIPEADRAKALAQTHLEIAYMWIGKAIRDNQIARNGMADLQEERGNE